MAERSSPLASLNRRCTPLLVVTISSASAAAPLVQGTAGLSSGVINKLLDNIATQYLYETDERALLYRCLDAIGARKGDVPAARRDAVIQAFSAIAPRDQPQSAELCARAIAQSLTTVPTSFRGYEAAQAMLGRSMTASIGVSVVAGTRGATVVSAIENAPADAAGLTRGDVILSAGGRSLAGLTEAEVISTLRGPSGSQVVLEVSKPGANVAATVLLQREHVVQPTVRSCLLEPGVAYLAMRTFDDQAYRQMIEQIRHLRLTHGAPLKAFILDLRRNQGGVLNGVTAVAGVFMKAGTPVTSLRARDGSTTPHNAGAPDRPGLPVLTPLVAAEIIGLPMTVLVSHHTAAGAEALAAALQDAKRATVVGTKTAGIGLVQSVMPIYDRALVMMATSSMLRPNGQEQQANAMQPDVLIDHPPNVDALPADWGDLDRPMTVARLRNDPAIVSSLRALLGPDGVRGDGQ